MSLFGSRAQVMHGTAQKTKGNLRKKDLKYNKNGRIVSKKVSALAKKNNRLVKAGYITKKGQFGSVMKGGMHEMPPQENDIKILSGEIPLDSNITSKLLSSKDFNLVKTIIIDDKIQIKIFQFMI